MAISEILFYFLSLLAIVCAAMVVISKNPVHSILYLIGLFFAISGHYVLLNAQFLAIVNIIVYAGAIMVLFLFVVMLMNLNKESEKTTNKWSSLTGVVAGGFLIISLVSFLKMKEFKTSVVKSRIDDSIAQAAGYQNTKAIPDSVTAVLVNKRVNFKDGEIGLVKNLGNALFNDYVVPFEISSILFLSAMVGAVVLGKRERRKENEVVETV
jgi:NADH-quinone oxidoreductase subunit J